MVALRTLRAVPGWGGAAVTLLALVSLEVLAVAGLRVPNPPAFVLLAVVFAAFTGGLRYGLWSAALAWLYFAWRFSIEGEPFRYTDENLARVLIWAGATPAMAFLVGTLKLEADRAGAVAVRAAVAEASALASESALQALSQSERRYRALAESISEGLLILQDGRFAYANPSAIALIGLAPDELVGSEFAPLVHPDFRALVQERHRGRSAGGVPEARYDIQIVRRAGDPLWVQIANARVEWEGRPAVLTVISDISARKNAETEIRRLNESLDQRVRERTAELESFSYSVSHDLRAPLRAIGGFARMVVEDEGPALSEEGRRKLSVVEANAVRMGALVDDLLALARLSQAPLVREELDVGALARDVKEELDAQYPGARLDISDVPRARADRTLLRQALVNLLDNALKYSSKAVASVAEFGWSDAERAYCVRDNGVGFDMRYANKLFRTFERLHAESEFPGTGIGLVIVQRVIGRHGGRIWARSEPGKGATFYFTLG